MAKRKKRLELTWIGKEERPRLEPRILLEDAELSYHAPKRVSDNDIFDNRLIHGDNLLALKALEQDFRGKVKCVYIDPPYNTGTAFKHYEDGLEHSIWLSLMRDRLEALHRLLSDDGSIWISIDDNEVHYLKVVLDDIFGRSNFVDTIIWQKIYTTKNSARHFSAMHDYVLVYAKDKERWRLNELPREEKQNKAYKNPDNDPRGRWKATPMHARNYYSLGRYSVTAPSGRKIDGPPSGTYWRVSEESFRKLQEDNRIWWGRDGSGVPAQKRFLSEVKSGVTPATLWLHTDAGHNGEAKNELRALFPNVDELFLTPKPERLLQRIIQIASSPGDVVLDSFAGSGTTGAVAHKMGRRWIMVELGDHSQSLIAPRMGKVIDGADPGGITETAGWRGGGGFRFFTLAPSLLETDKWGNWIVSKDYRPEMLAEAMCKLEGFTYAPDPDTFWLHGKSTETDFIYVTTQNLSRAQLQFISDQVGSERTLLICCGAFRAKKDEFPNLTVKKIPQAVLSRCEWGRDDYSLNVEKLPPVQVVEEAKTAKANGDETKSKRRRKQASAMQELPLFAGLDSQEKSK